MKKLCLMGNFVCLTCSCPRRDCKLIRRMVYAAVCVCALMCRWHMCLSLMGWWWWWWRWWGYLGYETVSKTKWSKRHNWKGRDKTKLNVRCGGALVPQHCRWVYKEMRQIQSERMNNTTNYIEYSLWNSLPHWRVSENTPLVFYSVSEMRWKPPDSKHKHWNERMK